MITSCPQWSRHYPVAKERGAIEQYSKKIIRTALINRAANLRCAQGIRNHWAEIR